METEAPASLGWHVDGTGVLAKHGTTLPQVDLETGASEGPMKSVKKEGGLNLTVVLISGAAGVAGFIGIKWFFDAPFYVFLAVAWTAQIIYGRLRALRGGAIAPHQVVVWTFVEEDRAKRLARRRLFRIVAMLLIAVTLLGTPLLMIGHTQDLITWIVRLFGVGIPLLVGLTIWMALDQGKTRIASGSPGWLRIERVHPEALAKLREMEKEISDKEMAVRATRRRLVKTSYYHRYPLSLLIGKNWKRPFLVLNIVIMKLLGSRLLERDSFHFSEAEEIPAGNLCDALGSFINDWFTAHPDWTLLSARRLPNPGGDMMVETVFLASAGLEHCASASHVWLTRNNGAGNSETCFFTWVEEDRVISTIDHKPLPLTNPRLIGQRISGTAAQVFDAHLKLCADHTISASRDAAELLARILRLMEEGDAFLTEAGFQSKVRAAG